MGDAVNTIATAFAFHDNFLVANLGLTELSAHVNVSNWSCREDGTHDYRVGRHACLPLLYRDCLFGIKAINLVYVIMTEWVRSL